MKEIGSIIEETVKKLGLNGQLTQYKALEIWDIAVGQKIADIAQPYDIKYKTMFVTVRDPVWVRQLKFLEGKIKGKINTLLGKKVVEKIIFRIGDLRQREAIKSKIAKTAGR